MADFMSVLAASNKQAAPAKVGNLLSSQIPEGLFESVLAAQLELPTDVAAAPLPPALVEQAKFALTAAAKKQAALPIDTVATDTDISGAIQAAALAQASALAQAAATTQASDVAQASDAAQISAATQAADPVQVSAVALPADATKASDVAQVSDPALASDAALASNTALASAAAQAAMAPVVMDKAATDKAAPAADAATRPVSLSLSSDWKAAATPAAQLQKQGQELPPTAAGAAAFAPTEPIAARHEPPAETSDASGINAARQLAQFEHTARAQEPIVRASLEAPVRSQAFPAELSDKIVWMAGRQSQWADLSLNPPQLGSLEVRLSLSGGETGAQFYSANPVVRELLEAALPRLRELMAQAGLTLGDANVREEAFRRRDGDAQAPASSGAASPSPAIAALGMATRSGHGLVDLYV